MKLLSPQQIQQWDAYTIEHEPIASVDLMERAAQRCTEWLIDNKYAKQGIKIFCGKGNNGGDGLVIARLLLQQHVEPEIYILEFGAIGTADFQINLQRLHQLTTRIHFIQDESHFPNLQPDDTIIDALLGSGLNRPLGELSEKLVLHINQSAATVISIDVPSGMFIHKSSKGNTIAAAKYTLTFQSLKLCFLVAENAPYFGNVSLLNIGLHPQFLENAESNFELLQQSQASQLLKPRNAFAHKGTFGHALLLAGNIGTMGAAVMATKACLRTGVGLLTVNVPKEGLNIIQSVVPEAMAITRNDENDLHKYATVGIGPGLGTGEASVKIVEHILTHYESPVVLDADALNILSLHKELLAKIPKDSIVTPHPKEFERLCGVCENDFERIDKAIAFAKQYNVIVILKGHYSVIACNGKAWFNTTGNAGMATGGSGDVLTGIITSLLAQRYQPVHAALLGVYLHGLSADLALEQQSMESLLPTDMIEYLGKSFYFLQQNF